MHTSNYAVGQRYGTIESVSQCLKKELYEDSTSNILSFCFEMLAMKTFNFTCRRLDEKKVVPTET